MIRINTRKHTTLLAPDNQNACDSDVGNHKTNDNDDTINNNNNNNNSNNTIS